MSTSLSGAPRAATACEQLARGGSVPAQSSRSIGFLMLVGSSLTLCGLMDNNNAMLSPSLLRYDPSKSNFRLLVTIVPFVLFAFLQTKHFKSRQSLSCLCGTAEAPLGMPEATPTTHEAVRRRIGRYFFRLPTLCEYSLAQHWARDWRALALTQVRGRRQCARLPSEAARELDAVLQTSRRDHERARPDRSRRVRCPLCVMSFPLRAAGLPLSTSPGLNRGGASLPGD